MAGNDEVTDGSTFLGTFRMKRGCIRARPSACAPGQVRCRKVLELWKGGKKDNKASKNTIKKKKKTKKKRRKKVPLQRRKKRLLILFCVWLEKLSYHPEHSMAAK